LIFPLALDINAPQLSPLLLELYPFIQCKVLSNMAAKRPIVVEGNTLEKPKINILLTKASSRKSLFQDGNILKKSSGKREWSEDETSALDQYICLFWGDAGCDKWHRMCQCG